MQYLKTFKIHEISFGKVENAIYLNYETKIFRHILFFIIEKLV